MDFEHEPQPDPGVGPSTMPEAARRAPWRQRRPIRTGAAAVVVAGVGLGGWLIGHSTSAPAAAASPTASPSPSRILAMGTLTIPFVGTDLLSANARDTAVDATGAPVINDPCAALGGYSDISEGTAVTIGGTQGQTLAVGPLSAGSVYGVAGQPASCRFTFSVAVPAGQSVYTVTISHRGTQTFTPEQIVGGIDLTLGN